MKDQGTITIAGGVQGNRLFMRATLLMGIDMTVAKTVLLNTLSRVTVSPRDVTLDDFGALLPDVEAELRRVLPEDKAAAAAARFRNFLMTTK